jgi:uncharacterized protein YjiS (DUF1127 family)
MMSKITGFKGDGALWPNPERPHLHPAERRLNALLGSLMSAPRRIAAALARELAVRRGMQSLASLDDRLLRDIGLERGQIDYAVRHGRQVRRMDDARSDLIRWS